MYAWQGALSSERTTALTAGSSANRPPFQTIQDCRQVQNARVRLAGTFGPRIIEQAQKSGCFRAL
jgi:hypothetical protein